MTEPLNRWKYRLLHLREIWEHLPVKQFINSHPKIMLGLFVGSVVLLAIAAGAALLSGGEKAGAFDYQQAWFYDLNTGEIYLSRADAAPPIKAPSGPRPDGSPAGVRAYMFRRDSDSGLTEPFVGYIETRDEGVSAGEYHQACKHKDESWGRGVLVRRPNDADWLPLDSEAGKALSMSFWAPQPGYNAVFPYYPLK